MGRVGVRGEGEGVRERGRGRARGTGTRVRAGGEGWGLIGNVVAEIAEWGARRAPRCMDE